MMSTPVLMEVAPSESNVARPPETLEEEWVAVAGGGFQRLVEYVCRPTIVKPRHKPRASTVARSDTTVGRRAKKPPVKFLNGGPSPRAPLPAWLPVTAPRR